MEELIIERDKSGRMLYNKEIHTRQGKPWTMDELVYLCKYSEKDGLETISFALERTPQSCSQKLVDLRKQGRFEDLCEMNDYYV